jgi:hypothetical protein
MPWASASDLIVLFNRVDSRGLKQEITGAYICGPYANNMPRNWFLVFTSSQTAWQLHLSANAGEYKPTIYPVPLDGFEANFASGEYYLARMGKFEMNQGVTLHEILDMICKNNGRFQIPSSRRGTRDFCLKVLTTLEEAFLFKEMRVDQVRSNLVEAFGEIHPIFPFTDL